MAHFLMRFISSRNFCSNPTPPFRSSSLPPSLRDTLRKLDETNLEKKFDYFISKTEIKARETERKMSEMRDEKLKEEVGKKLEEILSKLEEKKLTRYQQFVDTTEKFHITRLLKAGSPYGGMFWFLFTIDEQKKKINTELKKLYKVKEDRKEEDREEA